jgi:hypothetical protein
MFEVLESAKRVAEKSTQVRIDMQALVNLAEGWVSEGVKAPVWDEVHHFAGEDKETVSYLLVLDSLNFCFWPAHKKTRWEIQYGGENLSGYLALAASLKRAMESGVPITRADSLTGISMEALKHIFGGHGDLQLMESRLGILRELGLVLQKAYKGEACGLVEAAEGSAVGLVRLLAEQLESFRDVAEYRGQEVLFYKRAQIFVADLHGTFQGKSWGTFKDMDQLTAFADYKLPQVLRHLGILQYEKKLAGKVDAGILLAPGGMEEVEIRANTIWAVEELRKEMHRRGGGQSAYEIDGILWNLGQQDRYRAKPYHKVGRYIIRSHLKMPNCPIFLSGLNRYNKRIQGFEGSRVQVKKR